MTVSIVRILYSLVKYTHAARDLEDRFVYFDCHDWAGLSHPVQVTSHQLSTMIKAEFDPMAPCTALMMTTPTSALLGRMGLGPNYDNCLDCNQLT